MFDHDAIRGHLLNGLGFPAPVRTTTDLETLQKTEWSGEFEQLMRNRLVLGALRYGRFGDPNKPQWDRVPAMISRLTAYQKSGNLELLVDVANLSMLEFVEGNHPLRHWRSADDGPHVLTAETGQE